MRRKHPFGPVIFENTRILLIGTLPPETATWYFSNSNNTRLWDMLKSISLDDESISHHSNSLSKLEKMKILKSLNLGIYDIITNYDRKKENSTKDSDIIPKKYSDINNLVIDSKVHKLLFVYQSAAKWFLHSLTGEPPKMLNLLNYNLEYGEFYKLKIGNRDISCTLLPNPLNRGKKGETIEYKLGIYRKDIIY